MKAKNPSDVNSHFHALTRARSLITAMIYYHGTTKEKLRAIKRNGLRKGTFVSPDREVAGFFAATRSKWNGQEPVVLTLNSPAVSEVTQDGSGRRECQLLKTERGV